ASGDRRDVPVGIRRRTAAIALPRVEGQFAVDAGVVVWAAQQARSAPGLKAGGRTGDGSLARLKSSEEDHKGGQGAGARLEESRRLARSAKGGEERNESQGSGDEQGQSDREDADVPHREKPDRAQSEERRPPGTR